MLNTNETEDLEPFDKASAMRQLSELAWRFGEVKLKLYYRIQAYFHQSVASNYIKEEDLLKLINECVSIKNKYNETTQAIIDAKER